MSFQLFIMHRQFHTGAYEGPFQGTAASEHPLVKAHTTKRSANVLFLQVKRTVGTVNGIYDSM